MFKISLKPTSISPGPSATVVRLNKERKKSGLWASAFTGGITTPNCFFRFSMMRFADASACSGSNKEIRGIPCSFD